MRVILEKFAHPTLLFCCGCRTGENTAVRKVYYDLATHPAVSRKIGAKLWIVGCVIT